MGLCGYPGSRFACQRCGACCQRWDVQLDDDFLAGFDEDGLRRAAPQLGDRPLLVPGQDERGRERLYLARDGQRCIFYEVLSGEHGGGCLLHRLLGPATKPLSCRNYPYFLIISPAGPVVSLRLSCAGFWCGREEGQSLDEVAGERATDLRHEPQVFWPAELVPAPGRSLPAEALGGLQQQLLLLLGQVEPGSLAGLRAIARVLDPQPERPVPAGPPPDRRMLPWLAQAAAAMAEQLGRHMGNEWLKGQGAIEEPVLIRLKAAAQELSAEPERALPVPGCAAPVSSFLDVLLRCFVVNQCYATFADFTTGFGSLAVALPVLLFAAAQGKERIEEASWLGPALAALSAMGFFRGPHLADQTATLYRECLRNL